MTKSTRSVLGIDIGTGGSRALLLAPDGRLIASASSEHAPFRSPQTGWAEQDPEDWWRACQHAIGAALHEAGASAEDVVSIGLTGQMHGAVLLDDSGAVLRPSIIWCDQRTEAECRWLEATIGVERLLSLTANPPLTNFTLAKLLWIQAHEPDIWARARHLLLPKDYVRYRLSGEYAIDVADASGTLLLDVARRRWSQEVISTAGLDPSLLPRLFESPDVCAYVSRAAAAITGLRERTPIVAGAGDQAAGAIGMGITRPGAVSVTIGTSGVVFAATERPAIDPKGRVHTFCHAVPGLWHVMGVTQAAGLSLKWLRSVLGPGTSLSYDDLTAEAATAPPGADGVLWAPYLMGERTPHCDPNVRAALVGLAANHGRPHIIRALMEGVAFSLRDSFTIFSDMRVPIDCVRIGGGGARSKLWRQIQADVFGRAVETVGVEEGAAYGAAILAAVGAGWWPTVHAACDALVGPAAVIPPRANVAAHMNERYHVYRRLYGALQMIDTSGRSTAYV
jgi:xylulokinase